MLLRGLEVAAPAELRARIEVGATAGARVWPRLTPRHALGAATALAVLAVALVLALGGSGASSPSLAAAAALGQRAPATAAPAARVGRPKLLAVDVEGVPFPNWAAKFGWKAVGTRSDTIDSRGVRTVFYAKAGKRLAYTIVPGDPLNVPAGGAPAVREGTPLLAFASLAGRTAVTWVREGHTWPADGRRRAARDDAEAGRVEGAGCRPLLRWERPASSIPSASATTSTGCTARRGRCAARARTPRTSSRRPTRRCSPSRASCVATTTSATSCASCTTCFVSGLRSRRARPATVALTEDAAAAADPRGSGAERRVESRELLAIIAALRPTTATWSPPSTSPASPTRRRAGRWASREGTIH